MLGCLIYMIRPENQQTDKEALASAALTLANICTDPSYAQQVVEQGGALFLILQLSASSTAERIAAAVALGNLATNPHICAKIGAHPLDPISALVLFIHRSFSELNDALTCEAECATLALRNLSVDNDNKLRIYKAGGVTVALQVLATFEASACESRAGGGLGDSYVIHDVQPDSNLDDEMLEQEKCEVAAKLDAQGTLESSAAGSIDGDWSRKWRSSRARFEDTLAEVKSAICDRARLVSRGSKWIALKNSAILGGAGKLRVRLIQCAALPRMDLGSLCDCFCRIHVDELKVSESKVVEECIDPVFDEAFDFYVTNCASQTLKIEFLDKDDLEEEALEQQQKQFLREGAPTNKRSINPADLTTSMETATAMAAKMMEEDR